MINGSLENTTIILLNHNILLIERVKNDRDSIKDYLILDEKEEKVIEHEPK